MAEVSRRVTAPPPQTKMTEKQNEATHVLASSWFTTTVAARWPCTLDSFQLSMMRCSVATWASAADGAARLITVCTSSEFLRFSMLRFYFSNTVSSPQPHGMADDIDADLHDPNEGLGDDSDDDITALLQRATDVVDQSLVALTLPAAPVPAVHHASLRERVDVQDARLPVEVRAAEGMGAEDSYSMVSHYQNQRYQLLVTRAAEHRRLKTALDKVSCHV